MRAGDLTAAHCGKLISVGDRSGILRHVGRKAVTVDNVWMTLHVEVIDGNSVQFVRESETVLVEP